MAQSKITVAIADDHPVVVSGLVGIIEDSSKFEVIIQAADGKELLRELTKADKLPDIVVLDIRMPVMDGYEVMQVVKEKYPDLKVVVMSMFGSEFTTVEMFNLGVRGYVEKGCNPEKLMDALTAVNEGDYYNGTKISGRILAKLKKGIPISDISNKEREFLTLCCSELTYKEIADRMGMSERTIHGYRDSLCEKFHLKSREGLILFALKSGIFPNNSNSA